jgi:NRPS condensation-like uncharacterized protein
MERLSTSAAFNCVDKALFALHSQDESMVNHCVLTIDGAVDAIRLKSALMTVLHRHPTLRSIIHTGVLRQFREVRNDCGDDILTVWELAALQDAAKFNRNEIATKYKERVSEWLNMPLAPGRALACRALLLRRTLEESSLIFTCHHSGADGLHFLRFAAEVIEDYNGATEDPLPSAHPLPGRRRDELVVLAQACRQKVRLFYIRIVASLVHRFFLAPFSPNARICRRSPRSSPQIHFCQGSLNPHEVKQIRARSKSVGATLNDLLLAACFKTVQEWNDVHRKPTRKISVMVPVDIGNASFSPLSANQVSFISVSTTRKERTDADELLRTVRQETSRMLRNGVAFSIVYALHFCTRLPPRIPKSIAWFLMATRIYLDSILLTNLGLIWPRGGTAAAGNNLGNARITSVVVIPPVVSPMGMSLCAGTFDGHLHLSLTYKSQQFSEAEARTFLSLYLHELRGYERTREGLLVPEARLRGERETLPV